VSETTDLDNANRQILFFRYDFVAFPISEECQTEGRIARLGARTEISSRL